MDNLESGGGEPQDPKTSWEHSFTDPLHHDDQRFIYIVHGILSQDVRVMQREALKDLGILYDPSQDIDLIRNPRRISERKVLLTSIIDQNHKGTWGNRGLILRVPFENVIFASPQDTGVHFWKVEDLLKEKRKIPTVEEILDMTDGDVYNEIAIQGTTPAGKVEPIGVFAIVSQEGEMMDELGYKEISLAGVKNDLPFVEISK